MLLRGADGTIRWVKREVGVGQGDPIATLAYAIATIDALKAAAMMSGRRGNAARRANKGLAGLSGDCDVVEVPDWGAVWLGGVAWISTSFCRRLSWSG